ncbi:MAG TPA: hypothetical protein VER58_11800 [Thermoanaerobaculia bacterium]|nr:hypothetical protein [Thermoanaerobaculia bacterium]
MIAAIITALLAIAAGLPFSRRLGEAYLLGIGIQAAILCVLPWSRPIVIGAVLLECGALAPLWLRRHESGSKLPHSIFDLATLVLIAGYARFATIASPTEIDYICIWGLKAEKFWVAHGIDWNFLAQPFNAFAHPDYPLLVPFAYDFQALVGGAWIDRWAGALSIGCGIAALLIIRSELRGWIGAVSALILMPLVFSPYVGDAEGPLIAYSIAAILPLRRRENVTCSAVFLGLAASCKNEGLTLIIAVVIAMMISGARQLLPKLWPAVAIPFPWLVISRLHHLQSDLAEGGLIDRIVEHVTNPAPMLQAMAAYSPGRVLFWIGLATALAIGWRRVVTEERFLASVIALQLIAFIAAYVITPHDVSWHVRWSWERVVLQVTALVTFLAIVVSIPAPHQGEGVAAES